MDLSLYASVLWRFRALLAVGLAVAAIVAILAYVRIDIGTGGVDVSHRQPETWAARSVVLVTQQGFPWGLSVPEQEVIPVTPEGLPSYVVPRFADPSRFAELAVLYANLAQGDAVRRIMLEGGPVQGTVSAIALTQDRDVLPMIELTGLALSAGDAVALADRAAVALRTHIARLQQANEIPPDKRVLLETVERPEAAELLAPRRKTRPIFLFLAVTIVFVGLAFILENLRPSVRPVPAAAPVLEESPRPAASARQ